MCACEHIRLRGVEQTLRAAGFDPCAWPSDSFYIPPNGSFGYYWPQSSSLVKMEEALHELVGGWEYRWRVHTTNGDGGN